MLSMLVLAMLNNINAIIYQIGVYNYYYFCFCLQEKEKEKEEENEKVMVHVNDWELG